LAILRDVLLFRRYPKSGQIEAGDAAELARRDVPAHAVIRKIGERVAQGRKLPVEHREDPRLARGIDRVVEAKVAVDDGRAGLRRDVLRQPGNEVVHRLHRLGLRSLVLLAPACDLAVDVVSRLAERLQSYLFEANGMKTSNDAVELVPDCAALGFRHPRKRLVPQHAAVDEIHDVERRADDRLVLAQDVRPRHREPGRMQRLDDAELAVHRVRRGQKLARRLSPQHEAAAVGGGDQVSGIRLAALELLYPQRGTKTFYLRFQERFKSAGIDPVALLDGLGADELLEHAPASLPYNPRGMSKRFHVAHLAGAKFSRRGLRGYFEYRDLGIRRATRGKVLAHVIRARPQKAPHGEWHRHDCKVQFVYVLKGWALFEYEGVGKVLMK